jgi:hypothetical protein
LKIVLHISGGWYFLFFCWWVVTTFKRQSNHGWAQQRSLGEKVFSFRIRL